VRTVSVGDLAMVNVPEAGNRIGIEFAVEPSRVTDDVLSELVGRFTSLRWPHRRSFLAPQRCLVTS
jgi:hypothetical protein